MNVKELKVKEINELINNLKIEEWLSYVPVLLEDERASVKKIGEKLKNKHTKYIKEQDRVKALWRYEEVLLKKGYSAIVGIDEAGRGPLAGPVVAGAVILPPNLVIQGIDDSKKISKNKREEIYEIIMEKAISVGVGIVDHEKIDEINILQATYLAMTYAVENLSISPDYLLIDAVKIPNVQIEQCPIIEGDSKSISIAAGSIIAKVTRDRIMEQYHEVYPQYGFLSHKGYGTKKHYENIMTHGICPIHRKSFLKNLNR